MERILLAAARRRDFSDFEQDLADVFAAGHALVRRARIGQRVYPVDNRLDGPALDQWLNIVCERIANGALLRV